MLGGRARAAEDVVAVAAEPFLHTGRIREPCRLGGRGQGRDRLARDRVAAGPAWIGRMAGGAAPIAAMRRHEELLAALRREGGEPGRRLPGRSLERLLNRGWRGGGYVAAACDGGDDEDQGGEAGSSHVPSCRATPACAPAGPRQHEEGYMGCLKGSLTGHDRRAAGTAGDGFRDRCGSAG